MMNTDDAKKPESAVDETTFTQADTQEQEDVREPEDSLDDEVSKEASSKPSELEKALQEAADYKDRFVRLQAEWDNFRKRSAQEAQQQKARSTEYLIEALIPVIDDLERALEHAQTVQPEAEFKAFVDGVSAVYSKFVETLQSKTKLSIIDPLGEPFDALKHQAVGQVEDPNMYEDSVAAVYQKGYELGSYVIRPAMVAISIGGKARPLEN